MSAKSPLLDGFLHHRNEREEDRGEGSSLETSPKRRKNYIHIRVSVVFIGLKRHLLGHKEGLTSRHGMWAMDLKHRDCG